MPIEPNNEIGLVYFYHKEYKRGMPLHIIDARMTHATFQMRHLFEPIIAWSTTDREEWNARWLKLSCARLTADQMALMPETECLS